MVELNSESLTRFYQQYPRLVAVITAQANGRSNATTVARHTVVSTTPPTFGVAFASERFTYQLIAESKEFGLNFLPFEEAELVALVGSTGGWQIDKFQQFDITREQPVKTKVPILEAAYTAYECRLVDDRDYGDHRLLVGEIVAVHQLREVFTPAETLDLNRVSPTLYLGHELYLTSARDTVREIL